MDMMLQLMNENGQGSKSIETEQLQYDEVRKGKERGKAFLRSKYEYYKRLDEIRSHAPQVKIDINSYTKQDDPLAQ